MIGDESNSLSEGAETLPASARDFTKPHNFRSDIEGLRALAVLPVVLFHAGVPGIGGGYVGVDIFFVISGFLITGIIARQIADGRFSILDFYERRVRRIMPALFVVMAFVLAGTWILYLPSSYRQVPRSIVATLFFSSNILFWAEAGYFAAAALVKPMLHTWSLAVEEQFYLFFPLLLVLIKPLGPRARTATIAGIAIVSFALSVWLVRARPDFAFYLLPTRAWELMAGSLLAVGAIPAVRAQAVREALAAIGLALIGWAIFSFDSDTVFPGPNALFPVIGAALLIHVAPGTRVGWLLGRRPVTWIGALSYSLYLWHWPLIVFAEYATDAPLHGWDTVAVVVIAVVAAWLSLHFIEAPFRDRARIGRSRLFASAGLVSLVMIAAAGVAQIGNGWPHRFPAEVVRLDAAEHASSPMRLKCHQTGDSATRDAKPCLLGAPGVAPTMMLWGDSHGVEMSYALGERLAPRGEALAEQTLSSCAPVLGVPIKAQASCVAHNDRVLAYLRATPSIRTVVLAGFWADQVNARTPGLAAGLERTLAAIRAMGRSVILIGPVPPNPFAVPQHLAYLAEHGRLAEARGISVGELQAETAYLQPTIDRLARDGVRVVLPQSVLCPDSVCRIYTDSQPLYFDHHHLSVYGAEMVAKKVID
ncbi:peptidoglycan/LPS O-acetylase OafA/YrhL [Sphingomonas vulcanisoli]|uniref:Peptidoglycan/LPS O-acetylase OafA/YrhL n=1 Tax=Sphingomonas vulcanisoli TaxID=1658060 RepID=A0ABX0TRC4_9SPHN|nr:acyltransferase family protein [Sphingomonas vulcanisoli]NIJ08072.1 peptidoglycan/LPS O-acetylase OafA/YrhL [Sphingomonas vulcanisoli]